MTTDFLRMLYYNLDMQYQGRAVGTFWSVASVAIVV